MLHSPYATADLLMLAWLALGLVLLVLWALDMPGGYVHLVSPPVTQHQLALWVDGPSPNIRVELFWYNVLTRSRGVLLLVEVPVWGLFPLLGCICAIMLADALRGSKARQNVLRRAERACVLDARCTIISPPKEQADEREN